MCLAWRGSTRPKSGLSARFEMPTLAFISSRSNTAVPVVSLPVPLVVGTEESVHLIFSYKRWCKFLARLISYRFQNFTQNRASIKRDPLFIGSLKSIEDTIKMVRIWHGSENLELLSGSERENLFSWFGNCLAIMLHWSVSEDTKWSIKCKMLFV